MFIYTLFAFAHILHHSSIPTQFSSVKDETRVLQSQLDKTGYLQLPPGITYVAGLKVPLNGMIEGRGGEIRPVPGYRGPAIICHHGGFRINNVTLTGFDTGIEVNAIHVNSQHRSFRPPKHFPYFPVEEGCQMPYHCECPT